MWQLELETRLISLISENKGELFNCSSLYIKEITLKRGFSKYSRLSRSICHGLLRVDSGL